MHVLAHLGQLITLCEKASADVVELLRFIGANIEDLLGFGLVEGIDPHRKHSELSRTATGLVQTPRIRIKSRGCGRIDFTHALNVFRVRGQRAIEGHGFGIEAALIQIGQNLFGSIAQRNTQMIHQLEFSLLTQLRIQRQLGVSRPTLDQATAGVVADPAHHGGANTRRANH